MRYTYLKYFIRLVLRSDYSPVEIVDMYLSMFKVV